MIAIKVQGSMVILAFSYQYIVVLMEGVPL